MGFVLSGGEEQELCLLRWEIPGEGQVGGRGRESGTSSGLGHFEVLLFIQVEMGNRTSGDGPREKTLGIISL